MTHFGPELSRFAVMHKRAMLFPLECHLQDVPQGPKCEYSPMPKLRVSNSSVSLDGYGAGPNQDRGIP